MKYSLVMALISATLILGVPRSAHALFGLGDIVYDPANHAENVMTAARTLIQINNQVQQLANEAEMLINQARNLAPLPSSIAFDLQNSLIRMDTLIRNARGLAYDVTAIEDHYRRLLPDGYDDLVSVPQILADAKEVWREARDGFRHSLGVQAEVMRELRHDAVLLDQLMGHSQASSGNLQAMQTSNQLSALATKQIMQLQTLVAASARADALDRAAGIAAREQGRARFARFMGTGTAYNR